METIFRDGSVERKENIDEGEALKALREFFSSPTKVDELRFFKMLSGGEANAEEKEKEG